jgi:hypothetical protein
MTTGNQSVPGRDIEDLLPWYAAGTLNRHDAERVASAIASDAELARRLELVREELAATVDLNEGLAAPSARAAQKLFAAINAEAPPAGDGRTFDVAGRVSALLSTLSPRVLAWSAMAAVLLLLVQTGVITEVLLKGRGGTGAYETASAEQPGQAARQGSEVLVRFAPQASAADIVKFLKAHDATLVGGPTGDLFRVRVASARLSKAELDRVVRAMQGEKAVIALVLPGSN